MLKPTRLTVLTLASVVFAAGLYSTGFAQKTIKDPAEYNAYITALNTPDPGQKAASMEAFVIGYPSSIVKEDALEQAMAAYQSTGNIAKVQSTAERILVLDPNNIRALAVDVFIKRNAAAQDPRLGTEVAALAARGLTALPIWIKPDDMSDADFSKLKTQMSVIFNGAAGFAALQARDYPHARTYLKVVVEADATSLQDDYQFAIAELAGSPLEPLGFWYAAKAASMAKAQNNDAGYKSIETYGRAMYKNYHGSDAGWDDLIAAAGKQATPPQGFSVARKKTPAEIAIQAVAENDPASLSFSDDEFILSFRDASPENKAAADKVWSSLQTLQKNGATLIKLAVKVISATSTSMTAAITDENQEANKVDLEVSFAIPLTAPPTAGTKINLIGYLADYRPSPFVFVMKKAKIAQ